MTSGSNLKIRNSVYYARQVVPVDLAQHFPSRELVKSLNTKDRRTANVRKLAVLSEWHMRFDELRRKRNMTEGDFANATWAHYSAELLQDGTDRITKGNIDPVVRQHQIKAVNRRGTLTPYRHPILTP